MIMIIISFPFFIFCKFFIQTMGTTMSIQISSLERAVPYSRKYCALYENQGYSPAVFYMQEKHKTAIKKDPQLLGIRPISY